MSGLPEPPAPGHPPSHQSPFSLSTWGLRSAEDDAPFPILPGDPGSRSLPRNETGICWVSGGPSPVCSTSPYSHVII